MSLYPTTDERIGAERLYAEEAGKTYDFAWGEIEAHEKPEEVLADSLIEKYGAEGLRPSVALSIARFVVDMRQTCGVADLDVAKRTVSLITARIVKSDRPRLAAVCTRMALGLRESGKDSMRKVALDEGVTVARVSALTKEIRNMHDLGLNSFNKSAAAAQGYRHTNKTSRAKL